MNAESPVGGLTCAAVEDSLAELALGSLAGDARVAVLTHLQGCAQCRTEAEQLAAAADSLLLLAPRTEPPVGFEVKVFERIGITDPGAALPAMAPSAAGSSGAAAPGHSMGASPAGAAAPPPARRLGGAFTRLSRQGWAALAAAAVVVAIAAAFGGGWLANAPTPAPTPAAGSRHAPSAAVATATLWSGTQDVGTVSTFAGRHPWLLMTVHGVSVTGRVACDVTLADGRHVRAGSFQLHDGYGAWGARLPVATAAVHTARVVTPDGAVVASAVLRHQPGSHSSGYPEARGA